MSGTTRLVLLCAGSRPELVRELAGLAGKDLASVTRSGRDQQHPDGPAERPHRLALIASGIRDLEAKIQRTLTLLRSDRSQIRLANKVFYGIAEERRKTAFLFPGFGGQSADLLTGLYERFEAVREWFDGLDAAEIKRYRDNGYLFSTSPLGLEETARLRARYTAGEVVDAVLAGDIAYHHVLSSLGVRCDAMVGHSYGENAVLVAAGMVADVRAVTTVLLKVAKSARLPAESYVMLGVSGVARTAIERIVENGSFELFVALDNCPQQAVVCGQREDIEKAEALLESEGGFGMRLLGMDLPVHTPWMPVQPEQLHHYYSSLALHPARVPAYSCTSASLFPRQSRAVRELLVSQWARPVRFRETLERMYADGVRTFVEVGPGGLLTGFVRDTLRGRDVRAVASHRGGDPIAALQACLAQLFVEGHPIDLAQWREPSIDMTEELSRAWG